jgi:hypothetical protein
VEVDADGAFHWFDLEWELRGPLASSWLVLRNVAALRKDPEVMGSGSGFGSLAEMYDDVCKGLGLVPALDDDLAREADFQALALDGPDYDAHLATLTDALRRPFAARGFPRIADSEVVPRAMLGQWHVAGQALERALADTQRLLTETQRVLGEHRHVLAERERRDARLVFRLAAMAADFLDRRPWAKRVVGLAVRLARRRAG